ncbi:cold and drought-regulated protein CORA-like [Vicia villosa]|uniref:cold and drought-regulated protein CORA-like n=1 Tax=Vicia villosa TaxID=3911 RepID=UPI00273B9107|nr:cold and drought-regulated protein CORA-like [Vicia villosa]
MESKRAILILSLLAMVLLISSEVSAREFTETSTNTNEDIEKSNELNDAKFFGFHRHRHGHRHRHRHGHRHGGRHGGDSDNGN